MIRTLTGEKKHFIVRTSVAPGSEETFSRRIASVIDITERKNAEDVLKKALTEVGQLKDRL